MKFFFAGGENTTYRRMLMERGVERIAVNYVYAKNNLPKLLIEEEWPGVIVYCSKPREDYFDWVATNAGLLDLAITATGQWSPKWEGLGLAVPLWDGDDPVQFMQMVATTPSGWVAVSAKAARHQASMVRQADLSSRKVFGLGVSSIRLWEQIRFDAVANTDWSLAYQRREAQMVDAAGHIHRYRDDRLPVLAEDFGRQATEVLEGTEHTLGDALSGDRSALVSLSVSAWLGAERHWEAAPGNLIRLVVDNTGRLGPKPTRDPVLPQPDGEVVTGGLIEKLRRDDRTIIPVIAESSRGGRLSTVDGLQMGCDRCVIQQVCDQYRPGHECAYEIPVEVRTKEQLISLLQSIVELQTRRVLFASMIEQSMGGAPDPTTSAEIDRLGNLVKHAADVQSDRFRFTVEASGPGVLSRLFGGDIGQAAQQLPQAVPARQIMTDVIDADLLTEDD